MSGFMDTSKYTDKFSDKTPSFMDVSKYKFMDTSKYTKKKEQPKEMSFLDKAKAFLTSSSQVLPKSMPNTIGSALAKGTGDSYGFEDKQSIEESKNHPIAYNVGKVAGYVVPGSLISKGAENLISHTIGSAAKEVGKRVATSAVTGGGLTAAENAVAQTKRIINKEPLKPTKDIMKEIGVNTAAGGLLDLGLMGLGKVGSKIGESAFKNTVEENSVGLKRIQPNTFKPTSNTNLKEIAATSAFKQPPQVEIPQPRNGLKVVNDTLSETVPQTAGAKERGFNQTLSNDPNINEELRKNIKEQPFTYDPIKNKDTFNLAQKDMDKGFDSAKRQFEQSNMAKKYNPKDVVLGEMLIKHAADSGDIQQARELTGHLAEKLTEAGQFIQAAKILRRSDPEGFMVYVQRELNKVNQEGANKFGKKWNPIELTDDEIKSIGNMRNMTDEQKQAFQEQLYTGIAQRVPSTNMEKFNAWRRVSMLLNPLTHIRNVVGNSLFMPLRKSSDVVGSLLEKSLPQSERTKSLGWSFNPNIKNAVNKDWETVGKDIANNNNRWDLQGVLGREKRIFKNNTLEKINKFSGRSLEAEDTPFLKNAYKDALGGYMKAQGLTEVTQNARDYATRRALEATYKDMNKFSTLITAIKNKSGIFGEAILPFAKTPANLSVRAFEHSPYGLITELGKAAVQAKRGTFNSSKFIEQISKGVTGSVGLTGLGFALAHAGIITGSTSTDRDQAAFDKETGKLPYSINIGGKNYTYDWAQPVALPLAMGAEIYNKIKDNSGAVDAAYSAMIAGGDTLFNSSMLKSIKAVFGGTYSSPTEAITNTMMNFPKQAVPTIGGQVARVMDPYERDISSNNPIDALKNYGKSKTPGLSQSLPIKINTKGEEVKTEGVGNRILQNMILPFKVGNNSNNQVDKLIQQAYDETSNKNVFPKVAPKDISYKKTKYTLTPQEKNDFQKTMGQETYKRLEPLLKSNAPMKQKAKVIENIIDNAYDKAKIEFLRNKRSGN